MIRTLFVIAFFFQFKLLAQEVNWEANPNSYEYSMSLTCVVIDQNGQIINDNILIGVFDEDVCVGVGHTDTYFSPIDGNLGFVVVYGNSFNDFYNVKVVIDQVIYDANDLNFEANGIIGSLSIPYQIEPIYDGCTDSLALNYNPNAIINDGSCIEVVLGCTDESSYNFNPLANTDDQSCIPIIIGCTNDNYLEYDENANTSDEFFCINLIILGCQDDHYIEYNSEANIDDGSCNTTWQQAYSDLSQECGGIIESNIIIDLPIGWSMFGFTKSESINLIDATLCITDKIIVVKDYLGAVYLPEWNFNGVGSLYPGLGYQIKLNESAQNFKFCE